MPTIRRRTREVAGPYAREAAKCFVVGNNMLARGRIKEAVAFFAHSFRLEPCITTLHAIALGALAAEDWRKATGYCRWAAQEDPKNPESWYHLGAAYRGAGKWKKAAAAFRHVIELEPDHVGAHAELALLAGFKGDRDAEWMHADRALGVKAKDGHARFVQSTLQLWRGEYAEGWRGYEERHGLPLVQHGWNGPKGLEQRKRWRGECLG